MYHILISFFSSLFYFFFFSLAAYKKIKNKSMTMKFRCDVFYRVIYQIFYAFSLFVVDKLTIVFPCNFCPNFLCLLVQKSSTKEEI